jgi:polyisoprenoid-binding protein YceI
MGRFGAMVWYASSTISAISSHSTGTSGTPAAAPSAHLGASARVAVARRRHATECGGQRLGLLVAEVAGEVVGDAPEMHGLRLFEGSLAFGGQRRVRGPPVGRTSLPTDEAVPLHAVDEPGDAAAREQDGVGELAHAQLPAGLGQLGEDVEDGDREAPLRLELTVQRLDQLRLGAEEGLPGFELLVAELGFWGPGHGGHLTDGFSCAEYGCWYNRCSNKEIPRLATEDMTMSQIQADRAIEGIELPEPGDWQLDPVHTSVEFVARHLMVSKVRGKFTKVSGSIHIAEDPTQSRVEVTIDPASVETGDEGRDAHLRSPDFFDVERYPEITFRSTRVEGESPGGFLVHGDLTVHGVTRPVTLEVDYHGWTPSPFGDRRAGFSASTEVDREDFGLNWNVAIEAGGVVVGKKARLEFEIEAIKQS